jgi:signal transduction histidine kinase
VSRPWRTLRGRLALGSIAGVIVASIVFAATGVGLVRDQTVGAERSKLERQVRAIAAVMSDAAEQAIVVRGEGGYSPSPATIRNLEAIGGEGSSLTYTGVSLNPGGTSPASTLPSVLARQVSQSVLRERGVQSFDFTDPTRGVRTLAAAAPILVGGQYLGAVVLARDRNDLASAWRSIALRVLLAAAIGLVVALALVTWLTRRVTDPLARLQAATARVAGGDLGVTIERGGPEEVDALAAAFNTMVRELARRDELARDFLMRITHDLRTPLTAIRGHTQALADGVVPDPEVPRSLAAIEDETVRLDALVADLLDLARLQARRFRLDLGSVDPAELLERAFDGFGGEAARRGVDYERRIGPMPELVTDGARVRQIVENLLDNALRWTPAGGSVRLEAGARAGGGVVVVIADTGLGIPAGDLATIFDPFTSHETPDGRQGSGLGLAISRELAIALGGTLTAESREGAGSRFTLELPSEARQPAVALVG